MAYYNSNYYDNNNDLYNGEYSLSPYYNNNKNNNYCYNYNYNTPPQDSLVYSTSHEFFTYDNPTPFFYEPNSICPRIEYSVSSFSKPKNIEYEPAFYYPVKTHFIVSYNVTGFNEPDFEEYDPTPYGGGYDINQTYGKPLPPSDKTCYPRSTLGPNTISSNGPVVTKPSEKEEVVEKGAPEPQIESQPTIANDAEQQPSEYVADAGQNNIEQGENECENELSGEQQGYKQVPHVPSGYGLEAFDICESLFGYWPCLSRNNNNRRAHDYQPFVDCANNYGSQWDGAADYLFGNVNPYGDKRDDEASCGNAVYGYETHHREQPLYLQFEYVEDSWNG